MRGRDQVSLAAGGAALLVAVLVLGGAPRWAQAAVAALIAIALLVQVRSRRELTRTSPLLVLLGVAAGLTALQLVPLPAGVLDALTPAGHELREDGAALSSTAPWRALSLDPASTLRALAFLITLLGVAWLGLRIAASERGRYLILAGVAVTCGLAAAVTGFHTLLGADALYGVYQPRQATPPILGPLLNANHLGGLMAIGALLGLALVFHPRQASQLRVLWVVIAVGCSAAALASLSRGAALGLALGLASMIAIAIASRLGAGRDDPMERPRALINEVPITIVVAFGLAVAVYTSAGKIADQLETTSLTELNQPLSKYAAWRSAFTLVEDAPWVGIGRGALEPVFTRVHEPSAYVTFSHLENEYVQAIVEWGVPGAVLLALGLAWCVSVALRRWRDGALAAGAIGACAALAFQSSVDFGVELLGLAVPLTLTAATLLGSPLREARSSRSAAGPERVGRGGEGGASGERGEDRDRSVGRAGRRGRGGRAGRVGRVALVVALAGSAIALASPVTRSVLEDHERLTGPGAELAEALRVIERHPLDYLAYGEAAARLARASDPRAPRFLNHALRLHPSHPGLHRLAARLLVASGRRSQAAVEYALAVRGTLAPRHLLEEILARLPEVELAAQAIPIDAPNRAVVMRALHGLGHDDVAARWLERVVRGPRGDLQAIDELYALALRQRDLATAEYAARRRLALANTHASRIQLARVMFRREAFDQVIADLADVPKWRGRTDEQADAWLLVCDAHLEKRAWDPALECLHKLDGSGALAIARRTEVVKRLTIVSEQRAAEAKRKAIEQLERALGSRPSPP